MHLPLAQRYTIKVQPSYPVKQVRNWAKSTIQHHGLHCPHWLQYTLHHLQVIEMPMLTWNLKLVNVQRACKSHIWPVRAPPGLELPHPRPVLLDELIDPPAALPDIIRIPANSKSRFSFESHTAASEQSAYCSSFLSSTGINRDLATRIGNHQPKTIDEYHPPPHQIPSIAQQPASLATDLFRCTAGDDSVYTVEDKDPSVLWQVNTHKIFDLWYSLFEKQPTRWHISNLTEEDVVAKYQSILSNILPSNLLRRGRTFTADHIPYAYYTIKYKCFTEAPQRLCSLDIPPPRATDSTP